MTTQTGTQPVLTITVTETTVVFGGVANVYRYDRPSAADIASYVRSLLGPEPGGAVVHVVAVEEEVDKLDRAFAGYDITLTAERPGDPLDPDGGGVQRATPRAEWDTVQITRPSAGGGPRWVEGNGGWILAAAVVVVSAVAAGAIWASVGRSGEGPASPPRGRDAVTAAGPDAVEDDGGVVASREGEWASDGPAEPPTMVVERQGLRVELPAGFSLVPDGGMWRATGGDPNFRLQIAVDELFQLPPAEMLEQVLLDIERDPEVELVGNDGGVVMYLQRAPDGSETLWRTWADGGRQLFVGCHTRYAPTTVQQATCRMAMASAAFDSAAAGEAASHTG
ncbi:type VII secretion-associated protein [Corynebacterium sp. UBA2622]|uniref:type VII secretion-associated protein n=1 Tax=Corynebacterium sp. UBA2622 TaxID=1946393 RepID=UPI0025C1C973|nr:type VII secretion-associated protein [Corynebacterium sp. UBA2622]